MFMSAARHNPCLWFGSNLTQTSRVTSNTLRYRGKAPTTIDALPTIDPSEIDSSGFSLKPSEAF